MLLSRFEIIRQMLFIVHDKASMEWKTEARHCKATKDGTGN